MKLISAMSASLAVLALATILHTTTATPNKPPAVAQTRILSQARARLLARRLAAVNGCNANVCFAFDGSSAISAKEFRLEKDFVLDVGAIISVDRPIEMAAVQYATATSPVTKLTVNSEYFNLRVDAAAQDGGKSFVAGGLNYCFSQLWRRPFEANKIILLGDGITSFGANVARRADEFRSIDGDISVVAAGKANFKALKEIVGGDEKRVFYVGDFFGALSLEGIIEKLVKDVCGVAPL